MNTDLQLSAEKAVSALFSESTRDELKDKYLHRDLEGFSLTYKLFVRLGAKERRFRKVKFSYSVFDSCYLRNCVFDSCDFTGCRFVNSNFMGAKFENCTFDYSTFEKTQIDESILDSNCPSHENQKLRFARSLRINYQQLGETRGANKAILIELEATRTFLYKAWHSNESYYHHKFKGFAKLRMFFQWLWFRTLDLMWGNGESVPKLIRSVGVALLILMIVDLFHLGTPTAASSILQSIKNSLAIFFGTSSPQYLTPWMLAVVVFTRLVFMSFFMSIVIKKFNRR